MHTLMKYIMVALFFDRHLLMSHGLKTDLLKHSTEHQHICIMCVLFWRNQMQ